MKIYALLTLIALLSLSCSLLTDEEPDIKDIVCLPSTNLMGINATEESAVAVWDHPAKAGEGPDHTVEYGLTGFDLGKGLLSETTKFEDIILINLEASTEYQFYIRTNCNDGTGDLIAGPVSFMTD